ncbi:hypothetical protein [Fusobacterium nucleatum]|uniref:Uncharacterized protein n=1 Tax=Fusobacterium nucleatum subsp. nucleatum (strain ATCC 23726 / VPI 4351) TaxID=525283 RepID=D5RA53_FUSN2|nr:hypothetical protein [Fusobacterium nucleatum]EFG96358.1 hypothetical protein HMPREF0397_0088 [Fusobacterium nucleatum subsp. nucleatum ATCC 23726]ERT42282.1 hypothetical protein HMPREF1539_01607 [Fusobacterium nucleatum CTI-2]
MLVERNLQTVAWRKSDLNELKNYDDEELDGDFNFYRRIIRIEE